MAEVLWGQYGFSSEMLVPALRDAAVSDVLMGSQPEEWSPLSRLEAASLGLLNTDEDLFSGMAGSAFRLRAQEMLPDGAVWVTLEESGEPQAAIAFGADSFISFVPEGTDRFLVGTAPTELWDRESEISIRGAISGKLRGPITRHLMWRLYFGQNTARFDGAAPELDGLHRLLLKGTRRGGVIVGRMLYSLPLRATRGRPDPFTTKRLLSAEVRDRQTANDCPRLEDVLKPVSGTIGKLVVAVHGTMSTAVPLARTLRAAAPPGTPVVRFEHDTWQPIPDNARALATEITRLGTTDVLFVAHSRGGLVARNAAQLLRKEGARVQLLTLGTPFAGTPIVEGVHNGLLGVRALLGALRTVPPSVVVDPATRLLGWMIRGDLPAGLDDMSPGSRYLSAAAAFDEIPGHAVAGVVDDGYRFDAFGLEFLRGFAAEAFNRLPNDLVVGLDSAGAVKAQVDSIECDHFSYLIHPQVVQWMKDAVARLPSGYIRLDSESRPTT